MANTKTPSVQNVRMILTFVFDKWDNTRVHVIHFMKWNNCCDFLLISFYKMGLLLLGRNIFHLEQISFLKEGTISFDSYLSLKRTLTLKSNMIKL